MSRFRDQIAPITAAVLVIVVALSVVLLLRAANDQGTTALTDAKLAQVRSTADSFNARVTAGLSAVSGLGTAPWQLVPGSEADQKVLNSYNTNPNAQSGFFLVNETGTITTGILTRPGVLGSRFEPSDWAKIKTDLAAQAAVVLPVENTGLTTELPIYDYVVAIRGASPTSVRGALVFEEALSSTSAFQLEIAQLGEHAPSSAAWFFIDSRGSVVATTSDTGLGKPVEDERYVTTHSGSSELGNRLVFTADVPSIGWRVVFRERKSQFVSALTGPLQRAGLILVLLLLLIGLTLVVILVRRLRESREQQRRLVELTRSQSEFISVVSHELRTPVAGVLGFLQTTVDHWSSLNDEERLTTVRRAVTNARRLQAMTRDVLDTESIESGRLGYSFQRVDLVAELQTAVEGASSTHVIALSTPPTSIPVDADPDRMQQVFGNLLENARKSAPSDEPIVVETEIVGGDGPGLRPTVRVSVIDKGPGVDSASLERIFEKFVRGNDNAVTGTGLGLYIVRNIVEAHHGTIRCESTPGLRTAFVIELPLADASGGSGGGFDAETPAALTAPSG